VTRIGRSASLVRLATVTGEAADIGGPVLVVGAGLIGTSVAMALSREGVAVHLRDVDPTVAHVAASRAGLSDAPPADDPAVVVVATPPDQLAETIAAALDDFPQATVTDVGSVKAAVLRDLRERGADVARYVGGHPMAGSERSGPLASAPDLFDGRSWAVVAHDDSAPAAVADVEAMARRCGAVVVRMDAEQHDLAVARVSHLPHVVAAVTAGLLQGAPDDQLALSGQGLRDVTRIAGSDPVLWRQIVCANAAALAPLVAELRDRLDDLVTSLRTAQPDAVEKALAAGVAGAASVPGKHGGPTLSLTQVTVAIPDRPGALAELFAHVGEAGVNIEDLRIDHDPGRQYGHVELDVSADHADRLVDALTEREWTAHRYPRTS
jgi:prephenate dehydrogenase